VDNITALTLPTPSPQQKRGRHRGPGPAPGAPGTGPLRPASTAQARTKNPQTGNRQGHRGTKDRAIAKCSAGGLWNRGGGGGGRPHQNCQTAGNPGPWQKQGPWLICRNPPGHSLQRLWEAQGEPPRPGEPRGNQGNLASMAAPCRRYPARKNKTPGHPGGDEMAVGGTCATAEPGRPETAKPRLGRRGFGPERGGTVVRPGPAGGGKGPPGGGKLAARPPNQAMTAHQPRDQGGFSSNWDYGAGDNQGGGLPGALQRAVCGPNARKHEGPTPRKRSEKYLLRPTGHRRGGGPPPAKKTKRHQRPGPRTPSHRPFRGQWGRDGGVGTLGGTKGPPGGQASRGQIGRPGVGWGPGIRNKD